MTEGGTPSSSDRLRIWLEPGESGFWLRNAATGEALSHRDPRILVVKVAGVSYRTEGLQDNAFSPGRRLALVPEPDNKYDPDAVAVWDADRRLQVGYIPRTFAPELRGDEQAIALWEFRDDEGRRVGLRVLIAQPDAWIQEPRT